jgi:hypothetical protein
VTPSLQGDKIEYVKRERERERERERASREVSMQEETIRCLFSLV